MQNNSPFLSPTTTISKWEDVAPSFAKLANFSVTTAQDLEQFIQNYSDVLSVFGENFGWAFVHMTCDTANEDKKKHYEILAGEILPKIKQAQDQINQKILTHPALNNLDHNRYGLLLKKFRNAREMFSEKNVELEALLSPLEASFRQIVGGLTATVHGEELTLQQASLHLKSSDRNLRKEAWLAIHHARQAVKTKLDDLFDRMLKLRHQIAVNAGFANYRDFKHQEKERFDYTPKDCLQFHASVKTHVLPILKKILTRHKTELHLTHDYRPWDAEAVPQGITPLKPFCKQDDFLDKALRVFFNLDPTLAKNIATMRAHNLFDLESRKDKAPGGYNCYLDITGMPFIFMNAAGEHRDVVTLMHECGHATHNFFSHHESLQFYREFPTEMAETASMSMELMTSPYWQEFYPEKEAQTRARIEHLESIVLRLPWISLVDQFQHWIYLYPEHTREERDAKFTQLMREFGTGDIDWQGYEDILANTWQKQLHIFEIPFYYIEYGIAQIGALQIYRNFQSDPKSTLQNYKEGLKLGGSLALPKLWEKMHIRFDFSANTIKDLMLFVKEELETLYAE